MKFRLAFHPLVDLDLADAKRWYESIEARLQGRFRSALEEQFEALGNDALLYRARFADIRRVNPPIFKYGIFYFIYGELAIVLGVLHAARDSKKELRERRQRYEFQFD